MAFDYDLHLTSIPGTNARTMICFHGYGGNYTIADSLKSLGVTKSTLVSFNFPDYDLEKRSYDPHSLTFGTIQELIPAFYVLKTKVLDQGLECVDLYGYSAGGGALINLISILNTFSYEDELKKIGIGCKEKDRMLQAIQKGIIILDVPLKSIEEIIDMRGSSTELEILAKNYRENHLRPIDALSSLKGLSLDVLIHFQKQDEVIYNRDDDIFIERLKAANSGGVTSSVIGQDGGHAVPHFSLWTFYRQKMHSE